MREKGTFPPFGWQAEPEIERPVSRLESLRQRLNLYRTRFHNAILLSAGIIIALAAMLVYDTTKPPPQRLTQRDINAAVARALASATPQPSYESKVYDVIRPSLVRIEAVLAQTDQKTDAAVGTGVVIDDRGTILSSWHIVKNATKVTVRFADGSESEATVAVAQPSNDLVVLSPKEIPDDLIPATLTTSDTLQVGDDVVAVGNPFGISNSLSAGVVSGLHRRYRSQKNEVSLSDLIQFDAAVNPGNSGGPLLNRDGEVVGIVAMLLNPTEQDVFIGIGFAVPIETAAGAVGEPPY